MEERELLLERLELALDRIREIPGEDWQEESLQHWKEYFNSGSKIFTADRGYQTVPGAGKTEHCHFGRAETA